MITSRKAYPLTTTNAYSSAQKNSSPLERFELDSQERLRAGQEVVAWIFFLILLHHHKKTAFSLIGP